MEYHQPVLLEETINLLNVKEGGKYIDCTLGDGGHTLEILKRGGVVLGLDYSESSINRALERIKAEGLEKNFSSSLGNFKNIENIAKEHNFENIDGILYDLGYSSTQLQEDTGISFLKDQPLDMRIDKSVGVTAADLVNALSEKELTYIFREYSDENMARKFAKEIVRFRNLKKIQTTKELADLLSEVSPGYEHGRIHAATRVFQALRIAVNNELENLEFSLPRAAHLLLPGGRMLVISFHSLEDKLVKDFGHGARLCVREVNKKPIVPSAEEINRNNRSRSAKLRVFERVTNDESQKTI